MSDNQLFVFDRDKIQAQLDKIKDLPPFQPEKYEPRYSVTQLFETGIEVELKFVMRDGHQMIYASSKERKFKEPN